MRTFGRWLRIILRDAKTATSEAVVRLVDDLLFAPSPLSDARCYISNTWREAKGGWK
jgi:hypothetical protein